MPDFAGAILASHANYAAGGVSIMNPPQSSQNPDDVGHFQHSNIGLPTSAPEWQSIQKCHADYNQIPYGWRQSAFMGKCGYKIQARKFYAADTPCYPIQDLSCMGPTERRVWANICATEFPCKAPEPEIAKSVPLPPEASWLTRFMRDASTIVDTNLLLLFGVAFGSCVTFGLIGNTRTKRYEESEPDDKSSVDTN